MRSSASRQRVLWLSGVLGVAWLITLWAAPPAGAIFGCGINPFCLAGKGATAVIGGVAGDAITAVAHAIATAVGQAIATVTTLWVNVPVPSLGSPSSSGLVQPSPTVGFLQGSLQWFTLTLAAVSTAIGGLRLVISHRNGGQPARELVEGLLKFVTVTAGGLTLIWVFVQAGDQFSTWIIHQSLGCVHVNGKTDCSDFGANLLALLGFTAAASGGATAAFVVIVLGLVALLSAFVQVALMVVRGAMLIVLAGVLPLTAANPYTEMGRQWFRKSVAWIVALLLYKPAAAIVYAGAFRLAGSHAFDGGGQIYSMVAGLAMMTLALFALPALMRFVVPATAVLAGGGVGGLVGGAAAAAGMMMYGNPTGAVSVARLGMGSRGASPPPSEPTGAIGGGGGGGGPSGGGFGVGGGNGNGGGGGGGGNGGVPAGGSSNGSSAAAPAGRGGGANGGGGAASTTGVAAGGGAAAGWWVAGRTGRAATRLAHESNQDGGGPSGSS
jgi:type IV secretion system protein TrbL